ncbi:MAG: hypothetical protein NZO16_02010 [Deltaproteobacteria bacterium]|nr:hypothetical protein [Deltaproteobacteria bacterium]
MKRSHSIALVADKIAEMLVDHNFSQSECFSILQVFKSLEKNLNRISVLKRLVNFKQLGEKFILTIFSVKDDIKCSLAKVILFWFIDNFTSGSKISNSRLRAKNFINRLEKRVLSIFGIKKVEIHSAIDLDQKSQDDLKRICAHFGVSGNSIFEFHVSNKIVGSFQVFFDGKFVDASFETLINQFYNRYSQVLK